jgi:CDP-diacylglycerol--glycerol-3-phosphate 3-phosphatidyltransferase
MGKKAEKERSVLRNLPNMLTISRIIITFVVVYMIFAMYNVKITIAVFVIGALTDFFDGYLARKYGWRSEFGRKADMIADRFLWAGTALAFLLAYAFAGQLDLMHYLQIMFIMTREIVTAPFAIAALFSGRAIPKVRTIAKVTTFMQGFALTALILSIYYPMFSYISLPLSLAILVTGFISASHYINDISVKGK